MENEPVATQLQRAWHSAVPVDLLRTFSILQRGIGDPTIRLYPQEAWLAFATPQGDATVRVILAANRHDVHFLAMGPGAQWALDRAPDLLGAGDDWSAFDESEFFTGLPELIQRARQDQRALRLPRTHRVFDHAAGAVLEQRVTVIEANHAWRWLIRHHGRNAPGTVPEGLRIFPKPEQIASIPRWQWQQARVENTRLATMQRLAQVASRLELWADLGLAHARPAVKPPGTIEAALLSIPGFGPWSVAETLQRSHGSADHVSIGDFHLSDFVGQVLVGERVDDQRMMELLQPYAGHRQRVVRLLQLSGHRKQSYGPRYAPLDHRNR